MKKRVLTLALALVLACTALTGCGERESGAQNDPQGSDNPAVSGEKTELTLWSIYAEASSTVLKQLINKYNESSDKYHVTLENVGTVDQVRQKLQTSQKKYYPSVFMGTNNALYEYTSSDYTVPIQKYLDEDPDKWTEDMYDNVKAAYTDQDGVMVGALAGLSAKGYMVNVTALEAAGYTLEDVTSFEKIVEISKTACEKGVIKYGYCPGDGNDILDMLTYQGVDVLDADNGYGGKVTKSMYTEGETYEALKKLVSLLADLFESGAAYKNVSGFQGGTNTFVNGQTIFWTCTNSYVYLFDGMDLGFEWAFLPHVGVDENAKYKGCAMVEGTGLFIANTGDEVEMQGAYEFIKYLAQTENQVSWCTYRGYIPYTREAAASQEWITWRDQHFPSAVDLVERMQNTPADLRFPYSKLVNQMITNNKSILSNIMTNPKGDLDAYIQEAADSINQSIEIINMRGQ